MKNNKRSFYKIILDALNQLHKEKSNGLEAKATAAKTMLRQSRGAAEKVAELLTVEELAEVFDIVRSLVDKDSHPESIIALGEDFDPDASELFFIDAGFSPETKQRINNNMGEEIFKLDYINDLPCST